MKRTKLFDNGRINYSVKYKQFQIIMENKETGKQYTYLMQEELVKSYRFPFEFLKYSRTEPCFDTGEYYRS
jgi:hypothetical protein